VADSGTRTTLGRAVSSMSLSLPEAIGIGRSILTYYGIPFRARRLQRFYAQFISPGDLCFDLGAHVGNRTRAMLRLGARVVAVEPSPVFARLLRRWNGAQPRVTILEQAVGAFPGESPLLVSRRTPTVTTLSADWMRAVRRDRAFARVSWDHVERVQVTTLDRLIQQFGEPAFCKIDVEGSELAVLNGLTRPLRALSFEYIPATIEVAVGCIERLAALGRYAFNWTVAESTRLRRVDWCDGGEAARRLGALPSGSRSGDVYARLVV